MDSDVSHYRSVARKLPRPTLSQMKAFAEYVADSHSWYKKIPWWPSTTPFEFYLDPAAGMDWVIGEDGNVAVPTERLEQGFHYSSIKTARYREEFGYLTYLDPWRDAVMLVRNMDTDAAIRAIKLAQERNSASAYYDPEKRERQDLPFLISAAGTASLSALMHTYSCDVHHVIFAFPTVFSDGQAATYVKGALISGSGNIDSRLTLLQAKELVKAGRSRTWPEASGGNKQLAQIIDRALVLITDPSQKESVEDTLSIEAHGQDPVLFELFAPERNRQFAEIVSACERVCDLVHKEP